MIQPPLLEPIPLFATDAVAMRLQQPTVAPRVADRVADASGVFDAVVVSGKTPSPRAFWPSASALDIDGTSAGSTPLSPAAFIFFGREERAARTARKMLLASIYMELGSLDSNARPNASTSKGGFDLAGLAAFLADSDEYL